MKFIYYFDQELISDNSIPPYARLLPASETGLAKKVGDRSHFRPIRRNCGGGKRKKRCTGIGESWGAGKSNWALKWVIFGTELNDA
jgi:hypothetical protein